MNDNSNRFDNNQKKNGNNKGNPNGGQPPKKQNLLVFLVATLISLVVMSYFMKSFDDATTDEIPYNEFVQNPACL